MNEHWITAYWSQTYSDWSQIPLPTGRANPGLLLEHKHFVTDRWRDFQRNQIDVLRSRIEPRQLITTNLGGLGWANRFNRQLVAADLDIISRDEYLGCGLCDNTGNGTGHLDPIRSGATHDLVRGWRQQNFWVMEMPPGFVDWGSVSNSLDRGETRAMTWHAVGHEADREVYFITNFSTGPRVIALPGPMRDVLEGGEISRQALPRYGVAVLTRSLR